MTRRDASTIARRPLAIPRVQDATNELSPVADETSLPITTDFGPEAVTNSVAIAADATPVAFASPDAATKDRTAPAILAPDATTAEVAPVASDPVIQAMTADLSPDARLPVLARTARNCAVDTTPVSLAALISERNTRCPVVSRRPAVVSSTAATAPPVNRAAAAVTRLLPSFCSRSKTSGYPFSSSHAANNAIQPRNASARALKLAGSPEFGGVGGEGNVMRCHPASGGLCVNGGGFRRGFRPRSGRSCGPPSGSGHNRAGHRAPSCRTDPRRRLHRIRRSLMRCAS